MEWKVCKDCKDRKPLGEFPKAGRTTAGNQLHRAECKRCLAAKNPNRKSPEEVQRNRDEAAAARAAAKDKQLAKEWLRGKTCKGCMETKPLEQFPRSGKQQFGARCRACRSERSRELLEENPDRLAKERKRNRERMRRKREDSEFRERENAALVRKREEDPDYRARYYGRAAAWRKEKMQDPEYRERENRRQREKRANDPELRARESRRAKEKWENDPEFRERGLQAARHRHKEKWANDPNYREERKQRRRERMGKEVESVSMQQLLGEVGPLCAVCGEELGDGEGLHRDHILPWSRRDEFGRNAAGVPVAVLRWNIVPLHGGCNLEKSDRTLCEELQRRAREE